MAVRLVEAELLARGVRPVPPAVPDFPLFVLLAAEQDAARRITGDQHQHGFRFGKTGQVVEIAVVAIAIVGVAVAQALRCGGDHGHTGAHAFDQAGAAFGIRVHVRFRLAVRTEV
jgi:hypothetical protein